MAGGRNGKIQVFDSGYGDSAGQTTWLHLDFWRLHRPGLPSSQPAGPAEARAGASYWQHVSPSACILPSILCIIFSSVLLCSVLFFYMILFKLLVLNLHVPQLMYFVLDMANFLQCKDDLLQSFCNAFTIPSSFSQQIRAFWMLDHGHTKVHNQEAELILCIRRAWSKGQLNILLITLASLFQQP